MKKKNGFTLVELLAVIVVLAIIMIIAIPSVLDVMNSARKSSFVLYVDKVVTAVQTQYMYDANGGAIAGAGYYVYDITQDLNLTSTGNYKGYVVVDATNVDEVQYIVSLYDNNYQLLNYNVTLYQMPTVETESLQPYSVDTVSESASTAVRACKAWVPESEKDTANCYNRKGYLIVEGDAE